MPTGQVGAKPGPLFAAAGTWEVEMVGKGGHAAAGIGAGVVDPVVAASNAVTQLQSIISRNLLPWDKGVVSVTMFHAGDAYNVIPSSVVFGGTIRAFSRETYNLIEQRAKTIIQNTAEAFGCTVKMSFTSFDDDCLEGNGTPSHFPSGCTYPAVLNDPEAYELSKGAAKSLFGPEHVVEAEATLGGEDFAYFAEKTPSSFMFVGIGNETKGTTAGLHSPNFKLDEEALPIGAALHVATALHALQELSGLKGPSAEL
mmetsp:Transcript_47527/g.74243  ORF Transcript_47527/g.74243 Transcript_47527/m.74243 type:complete len:256 (+) Transcript_47527:3-770(+)